MEEDVKNHKDIDEIVENLNHEMQKAINRKRFTEGCMGDPLDMDDLEMWMEETTYLAGYIAALGEAIKIIYSS